ncbi:MAG TPA: HAD family hydrolase [Candidatus Nanoarchaeia archaeon]|nr:HAD family hydrolase [Candidatus Nanoarchaeia archaeon]
MKKTIIFDFWGTLVEQGVYSPLKQVRRILGIQMEYPEFVVQLEKVMMTRPFDSLTDAFTAACASFNVNPNPQLIEELIGLWNKNWLLAKPYDDTVDVLKDLKKKYRLVLISNTDNFSVERVLDKFNLRDSFDVLFLSYQQGMIKTEPAFYEKIFEDLNASAADCMAVGDSIESDMAAAQRVGVHAVLVDRRSVREFTPKIKNLRELQWK